MDKHRDIFFSFEYKNYKYNEVFVGMGDIVRLNTYKHSKKTKQVINEWENHILPRFKQEKVQPLIKNLEDSWKAYFVALHEYLPFL
jgi:hypothetical protein